MSHWSYPRLNDPMTAKSFLKKLQEINRARDRKGKKCLDQAKVFYLVPSYLRNNLDLVKAIIY